MCQALCLIFLSDVIKLVESSLKYWLNSTKSHVVELMHCKYVTIISANSVILELVVFIIAAKSKEVVRFIIPKFTSYRWPDLIMLQVKVVEFGKSSRDFDAVTAGNHLPTG